MPVPSLACIQGLAVYLQWYSVGSHRPSSFFSSGVAPEDQALYVCEARNVFGKAQAEAQLLVTGHGLWVNLEAMGSGRQVL